MRFVCLFIAGVLLFGALEAQPTVIRSFPTAPFGSGFPGGLGYDARTGNLFVIDETNKAAYEVTRAGASVSTIDLQALGIIQPIGAGVDPMGRMLYIAEEINKKVWEIDLKTRTVVTMTPTGAYSDPSGLDYNPTGHTVVMSDDSVGVIHELDLMTKQTITTLNVKSLCGDADGLGCNTYNGLYIVGDDTGAKIVEIAADGFVMNTWNSKTYGIQDPEGVCMDPLNGNYFISTTVTPDTVYEVAGGLTLKPALTADHVTVAKGQVVTITLRSDSARWRFGGIALFTLGGGSIPPLVLRQGVLDNRGQIRFKFKNPGLGGIKAGLFGAGFSTSTAAISTPLTLTFN